MYVLAWALVYSILYFSPLNRLCGWPFISRLLSIYNAATISGTAIFVVYLNGLADLYDFFFQPQSELIQSLITDMLKFFRAYLFVDLSFFLLAIVQGKNPKERGRLMNIVHHFVGLISMQAFLVADTYYTNSLFYAFTEISTVPLHLAWMVSPNNPNLQNTEIYSVFMMVFGVIAYVLFFLTRILGSIWLWTFYIIPNYQNALEIVWWQQVFLLGGNGVLTFLNWYWFRKMTLLLMAKLGGGRRKEN